MGQALDHEGTVLGEAHGATKKEVFDALNEKHPTAHEIRVMSEQLKPEQAPPHTKLNAGPYDCYAKLIPNEPYFVLRAKDPDAPAIVEAWALARSMRPGNESNPKIGEARQVAHEMRLWRMENIVDTPAGPQLREKA